MKLRQQVIFWLCVITAECGTLLAEHPDVSAVGAAVIGLEFWIVGLAIWLAWFAGR